jgi:hypothetical protein
MRQQIDPHHTATRAMLRIIGPSVAGIGLLFTLVAVASFFSALGTFEPPRYFWCAFVGLPLLAVGIALSKFAFMGAVTRYMANEVAPVGKDVVNYMAEGTKDAVRELATAVGEGLRTGKTEQGGSVVPCPKCNVDNERSAKFCSACGTALHSSQACPACGALNDADARFCDHCGRLID